jgi:hypothetical protein
MTQTNREEELKEVMKSRKYGALFMLAEAELKGIQIGKQLQKEEDEKNFEELNKFTCDLVKQKEDNKFLITCLKKGSKDNSEHICRLEQEIQRLKNELNTFVCSNKKEQEGIKTGNVHNLFSVPSCFNCQKLQQEIQRLKEEMKTAELNFVELLMNVPQAKSYVINRIKESEKK